MAGRSRSLSDAMRIQKLVLPRESFFVLELVTPSLEAQKILALVIINSSIGLSVPP